MKPISFLLLIFFFFCRPAVADEGLIVIMADKESYNIGDVIRLKLELKGQGFSLGEIDKQKIAPFEVIKKEEIYDEETDSTRFIISGRIFKTGDVIIPPFLFIDDAGNKILSEQAVLRIVPLLNADNEKLREMKPQVAVSQSGPLWPWIVIAMIIVVLSAFFYLSMRKKKETAESEEEAVQIPPHIKALEEIERIEGLNLIRDGKVKELYIRVSDVVRNFKGKINGMDAMEMTTGELIESLRKKNGTGLVSLEQFLDNCDMVKFAKYMPAQIDIEGLTGRAREIINQDPPQDDLQWEPSHADGNSVASLQKAG